MAMVIGLTGGIASGKSTVSAYLAQKGLAILDADKVVHELQEVGGALYQALVSYFGKSILQENQELDRVKLSQMIFASDEVMQTSNAIQQSIIREELASRLADLVAQFDVIVMDIPLLFEQSYDDWCDRTWLVAVDQAVQEERLMQRNAYTREEVRQRIASQMPLADKRQKADDIIDNSGTVTETYNQIDHLLSSLDIKI